MTTCAIRYTWNERQETICQLTLLYVRLLDRSENPTRAAAALTKANPIITRLFESEPPVVGSTVGTVAVGAAVATDTATGVDVT